MKKDIDYFEMEMPNIDAATVQVAGEEGNLVPVREGKGGQQGFFFAMVGV